MRLRALFYVGLDCSGGCMKRFLDKEISKDYVYLSIKELLCWSFACGLFGGVILGFLELYK